MHKIEVRELWSEQSALSLADWFVKLQSAISRIFFPFFFVERRCGAEGAKQEVFSKPVNSTFSSQAQKFLLFMQKKGQTSPFHVSYVQLEMSQLCHKRTKHAWCLFFQKVS